MRSAAAVHSLALSPEAVDMARQLAEPDGKVVFELHPLCNSTETWSSRDPYDRTRETSTADPVRQLLTYGLAEVAQCSPPFVLRNGWGDDILHPWQIVLTERGRAWLADGASTRIQPPMRLPGRRARRLMRRAA
jgi:hypothetical protein